LASDAVVKLRPACKAQSRAGASRSAIARHIFEPIQVEMLAGAGNADPVEDFRTAGVKLVARQVLQKVGILVGACLENGAVEILIDQEMAHAARRNHADP